MSPARRSSCRILCITSGASYRLLQEFLTLGRAAELEHQASDVDALQTLRGLPATQLPNLVIISSRLPALSGVEFIRMMKEDRKLRHIPIVVEDSEVPSGGVDDLYSAGATCVLRTAQGLDEFSSKIEGFRQFWLEWVLLPGQRLED